MQRPRAKNVQAAKVDALERWEKQIGMHVRRVDGIFQRVERGASEA